MRLVLYDDNDDLYTEYTDVALRDENTGDLALTQGGKQFLAFSDGSLDDQLTDDVFNIQYRR